MSKRQAQLRRKEYKAFLAKWPNRKDGIPVPLDFFRTYEDTLLNWEREMGRVEELQELYDFICNKNDELLKEIKQWRKSYDQLAEKK